MIRVEFKNITPQYKIFDLTTIVAFTMTVEFITCWRHEVEINPQL